MGFLRRMAGVLGFIHGEDAPETPNEDNDRDGASEENIRRAGDAASASGQGNRKGFSVQVPVPVERSQIGPVLVACEAGDGGVQGFKWHGRRLRIDEDGDVAEEFFDEASPDNSRPVPLFQAKHSARPAVVRKQIMADDGSIRHGVELRGRIQWI